MAEAHPVGFQWVMEAGARGARVIHVDPRFSRTSASADTFVPLRAGSDIVFLGGIVNYILSNDKYFHDYVVAYTNAATLVSEGFRDVDDLDGVFSGYDPETGTYDTASWSYEGVEEHSAAGAMATPDQQDGADGDGTGAAEGGADDGRPADARTMAHELGGHGASLEHARVERDETLQHPRTVFQVLKRHYARYTPELVEEVCGVTREQFLDVCEAVTANSGRDRTTCWVYSVGWTQHSVGVQYIRGAAIIQLLLGNMGRPGGGIMALRGHASIQGSTDIPTLFDLLPGYLPMPKADGHGRDLEHYLETVSSPEEKGFWAKADTYMVSLLKAWWGEHATADNGFCFDYLPRLTGDHSTFPTTLAMLDDQVEGYMLLGQNPAVGSAHGRAQRLAMAHLKWLVVRDLRLIDSATFWKDSPEIATGELRTEEIGTEVFFFPAASHVEKDGTFTQTQRMLQWHHKAVEPPGDCRSDLHFFFHLGRKIKERLAGSTDERDRPVLDLVWDYPTDSRGEPSAEAVLQEINGRHLSGDKAGQPLSTFTEMKADGSTTGGCWIYCGVYADGVNQAARRKPGREQSWVAPEWGWAWPANRRILYNRASADLDGRPWSERKAVVWWDPEAGRWTGHDVPDFPVQLAPSYRPPRGTGGPEGLAGDDPFIMQADGKGWLFAPSGLLDGPLPTHYEPHESPFRNPLYSQQGNPTRKVYERPDNPYNPSPPEPHSDVFPYVLSNSRLTEHHTAGGMSRWLPYLSELQPELTVEVSPELARVRGLEHLGWAHVVTSRTAVEARVVVTDRMAPLRVQDRVVHQVWMPYHWGTVGLVRGDIVNDLFGVALDPNVLIQESKVTTCDIRPGRRPRGPDLLAYVEGYRRRAGVTLETGSHVATVGWTDGQVDSPEQRERRWPTRPATPDTSTIPRGSGSSPTRRCASAARPARSPARSGTSSPTTASTCWACRWTTPATSAPTPGGTWPSSNGIARSVASPPRWPGCRPARPGSRR
jgi:formate dehydrogenase major subunit